MDAQTESYIAGLEHEVASIEASIARGEEDGDDARVTRGKRRLDEVAVELKRVARQGVTPAAPRETADAAPAPERTTPKRGSAAKGR